MAKILPTYLSAPFNTFELLCRKFAASYFVRRTIKIRNIMDNTNSNGSVDLMASIFDPKWRATDYVLIRFFRSQDTVEEQAIRDFYSRVKERKANKGICVSAGNFSEGAWDYKGVRPLKLLGKDHLIAVLTLEKMPKVHGPTELIALFQKIREENNGALVTV